MSDFCSEQKRESDRRGIRYNFSLWAEEPKNCVNLKEINTLILIYGSRPCSCSYSWNHKKFL